MKIEPFSKLDLVSLDTRRDELGNIFSSPLNKGVNRVGLEEFDCGDRVFRFESNWRLREVTVEAKQIELGRVSVSFARLADFIAANDPHAFEKHGFIVSPAYGIAFDLQHRPWVTVLTRRGLEEWTKL